MASQSPRRVEILDRFNVPFTQIKRASFDEPAIASNEHPLDYSVRVASEKANQIKITDDGFILAVDTIVVLNHFIFGKPSSLSQAINQLQLFQGKTHQVISSCVLLNKERNHWDVCIDYALVTFKSNCLDDINDYVNHYHPLDKAGSYGIQDSPPFIENISGDFYTIMGLPIKSLLKILSDYGMVKS